MYNDSVIMETPKPRDMSVIVEQIVPGKVCFACDVCCRFPEQDSALRPYFTKEEIWAAVRATGSTSARPRTS